MHSLISSILPSEIFNGKNGSAIDGLAAPIKSWEPALNNSAILSGDVNLPTATTGFFVKDLAAEMLDTKDPSLTKRELPISML